MSTRIEVVELLSFKLTVPRETLELLPEELDTECKLVVEREDGELVLAEKSGDSFLRFRELKDNVSMSGALICNDTEGRFFRQVLCGLVMRYGGDLEARIMWNDASLNSAGEYAELRLKGGKALPSPRGNQLRGGTVAELAPKGDAAAAAPAVDPEILEIEKLLDRADREWAEYQRLKAERMSQGA